MTTQQPTDNSQPIQTVPVKFTAPVPPPNTWMRSGYSPAEIILAIAILITSLGSLLAVLVPVMTQHKESETPVPVIIQYKEPEALIPVIMQQQEPESK